MRKIVGELRAEDVGDRARVVTSVHDDLVRVLGERPRPWLIGLDLDATLTPLHDGRPATRLVPGATEALDHLTRRVGVMVAVVSDRPLADLRRTLDLPREVMLLGSRNTGSESTSSQRTDREQHHIDSTLTMLEAVARRLPGAWIEHKPLAVVLHVRQADPVQSSAALAELEPALRASPELTIHRGHLALEVAIRPNSKVDAFGQLRSRLEPSTTIFAGADHSDERVFQSLAAMDLSIKIGEGATSASYRLDSPESVVEFLAELASS